MTSRASEREVVRVFREAHYSEGATNEDATGQLITLHDVVKLRLAKVLAGFLQDVVGAVALVCFSVDDAGNEAVDAGDVVDGHDVACLFV